MGNRGRQLPRKQDVLHQILKRQAFGMRLGKVRLFDLGREIQCDRHGWCLCSFSLAWNLQLTKVRPSSMKTAGGNASWVELASCQSCREILRQEPRQNR